MSDINVPMNSASQEQMEENAKTIKKIQEKSKTEPKKPDLTNLDSNTHTNLGAVIKNNVNTPMNTSTNIGLSTNNSVKKSSGLIAGSTAALAQTISDVNDEQNVSQKKKTFEGQTITSAEGKNFITKEEYDNQKKMSAYGLTAACSAVAASSIPDSNTFATKGNSVSWSTGSVRAINDNTTNVADKYQANTNVASSGTGNNNDISAPVAGVSKAMADSLSNAVSGSKSTGGTWTFTADSDLQLSVKDYLNKAADSFTTEYNSIYSEIDNMSESWVGEDYNAFVNGTNGYKDALSDLADSFKMYADHFDRMSTGTEELATQLSNIITNITSVN